ncbi:hypothetical protein GJ496_008777 [Pomphorhynchus laevis]|nr:hypothetical protein GJ496_008777 [Pomphorhynchus laevis]
MRRQKLSLFLLILVILTFVNFLIHGGDQNDYSSKYLKQHKIFKSSICAISAIFGSINKFVFIADPIFANLTDLKTLSEKREVTVGIFAYPEEFTDDVLQNLKDTYFYINISSVMCSGTNTIGALIIDDGRQLIYIHIFESTGDYYRICSIELPDRFPFGDVDRSMDM